MPAGVSIYYIAWACMHVPVTTGMALQTEELSTISIFFLH